MTSEKIDAIITAEFTDLYAMPCSLQTERCAAKDRIALIINAVDTPSTAGGKTLPDYAERIRIMVNREKLLKLIEYLDEEERKGLPICDRDPLG